MQSIINSENTASRKPHVPVNSNDAQVFDRFLQPGRTLLRLFLLCVLVPAGITLAQDNKPQTPTITDPLTVHSKFIYEGGKMILLLSAEKVPEEYYSFKPTDAVRSFGQIIGHLADSQYGFCSVVLGEKNPAPKIEMTKTSKADLIVALKDAFAYCDRAYIGMTDVSGSQMVKFSSPIGVLPTPKLGMLNLNIGHNAEHYGNLVTYMRLKNIIPPTSDPDALKRAQKLMTK